MVAGQERLELVGAVGPAVADDLDVVGDLRVAASPVAEQVVDDREEPVLGRVPGLEQVVVEADVVDRGDRDVGVGVRREQQPLGLGRELARLAQQLDAGLLRHPLVADDQRDRVGRAAPATRAARAPGRPTSPTARGTPSRTAASGRGSARPTPAGRRRRSGSSAGSCVRPPGRTRVGSRADSGVAALLLDAGHRGRVVDPVVVERLLHRVATDPALLGQRRPGPGRPPTPRRS